MGFDWLSPKNYKRHYICLECQKGFKRPSKKDMKNPVTVDLSRLMEEFYEHGQDLDILEYIQGSLQPLKVTCPNCKGQMFQVHYNFEVPSQRNKRAWDKVKEEISSKSKAPYDAYIKWHRIALRNVAKKSIEFERLTQNLMKLEKFRETI